MKKLFLISLLILFPIMGNSDVFGQASKTNSGDVVCPATGSSIQILAPNAGRYSYTLNNTSGIDVRIGYLASPSTAALNNTNSWLLKAGQPYTDSTPGVLTARVVCMSTTAGAATMTFNETFR